MHERVNKKDVNDNKAFYQTIKRFPSGKTREQKIFVEKNLLVTDDKKVAGSLKNFFAKVVVTLNIPRRGYSRPVLG